MKQKLLLALLALFTLGGSNLFAQTDVTDQYITNASFEYSAEGVAYTETKELNNGEAIYGWTGATISANTKNIQVTNSAPNSGFGTTSASDGSFFYFIRQGWENKVSSITQDVTLPAGRYYITADYKEAEAHDNGNFLNSQVGISIKQGDNNLKNFSTGGSVNAPGNTYFTDTKWKTISTWFDVTEDGIVNIALTFTLNGSSKRADLCLDNIRLYKWDLNDQINYDNASTTSPLDVTEKYVTNPYFDENVNGWTSTTGYLNNTRATNQAGAISGGFYENWNGSAKTSGKMYQTLDGLVDGIYRVTAAVMVNSDNSNVSLYAGSQKTSATNNNTPSFYSVQSTVSGGTLEIGLQLGDGNAANWIGLDNVKLEYLGFDVEAAIAAANEQATAAESHLSDKAYTGYISNLQVAIDAIKALNAETATKASIQTALNNLTEAINNVSMSVTDYENLKINITNAKVYSVVNSGNATNYENAISAAETIYNDASVESTAETILSLQNFKVADYNYVTSTYTESASLGTWTEDFAEDLNGEGYKSGGDKYWNEWGNNTRTAKQTVTLPAGDYAISVIARGNVGTSGYLYYKIGENKEVKVNFLMKGNRGRGVDTNGKANFSDEGSYNCNNEGFGWEYRFLTFTLTEETSVELGVSATFANSWVSIYAPKLFTTEASIKNLRLAEIATALSNIPVGKMNKGVKETLDEKVTVAEAANINNTKEELATILQELNDAITAASNSIAAYTAANEKLIKMKAIVESTNVYTAGAEEIYYTQWAYKYENNTLTDEEANALVDPNATTGYRAESPEVSKFLISAWDAELNNWDGLHVNTWSAATDFGETGFAVPLTEYWVGSGSLVAKTMTATISNIEEGNYKVSANMFVKATSVPTGISMQVGDAEAAAVTGTQNGDFFVSEATAFGTVGEDGNLVIKLIVAERNNTNWIGFKNMKYEKVNVDYAALNAAIATANAVNATINGGVKALTDAIDAAQELLTSADQNAIDEAVTTLNAATETAKTTITARKNLAGVAKKAAALKGYLDNDITEAINVATSYAANAEATAEEANTKANALNANFAAWEVVTLNNGTFDVESDWQTDNVVAGGNANSKEITGWNSTQGASWSSSAAFGFGSTGQINGASIPANDIYGKNEGGMLGISLGWGGTIKYTQTIESLPAGKYVLYYEAYNGNTSSSKVGANLIGLNSKYSSETDFGTSVWNAYASLVELENTTTNVEVSVGGTGVSGTGSGGSAKFVIDNVTIYCISTTEMADAEDYAELAAAITAAEANTLGFDADEYAPYNNVAALQALAAAKAIDPEAEDGNTKEVVQNATAALTAATWTANTEEVDAIFDGQFATTAANTTSGDINLPGWTKVQGIRLLVKDVTVDPGLAYTDGKAAVFSWGGTTLTYGEQEGYTLPMNKNSLYELTLKVSGWRDGDMPNVVSVDFDGVTQSVEPAVQAINISEGNPFAELKFYVTPTADNSTLKIYANKHFTIADLSMKLANAIRLTDEAEVVPETTTNEVTVLYDRKLLLGWNSLVLPFDVTKEELGINESEAEDGERVLEYKGTEKNGESDYTLNFDRLTGNVLAANTPYLIKKSADGESMQFSGKIISPVAEPKVADNTEAYDFVGTYVAITKEENKIKAGDLTIGASQLNKAKAPKAMKAFRAFFRCVLPAEEALNARITVNIDGQETDAITAIEIFKTMTEGIYNLQGQKVNKAQKGVYIVNGKKVVIK